VLKETMDGLVNMQREVKELPSFLDISKSADCGVFALVRDKDIGDTQWEHTFVKGDTRFLQRVAGNWMIEERGRKQEVDGQIRAG
jgi:hypothetical protein